MPLILLQSLPELSLIVGLVTCTLSIAGLGVAIYCLCRIVNTQSINMAKLSSQFLIAKAGDSDDEKKLRAAALAAKLAGISDMPNVKSEKAKKKEPELTKEEKGKLTFVQGVM